MRKILILILAICLSAGLLASCAGTGEGGCNHRDGDDNALCDECGLAFEDGEETPEDPETPETPENPSDPETPEACEHRDADDNGECDECGEDFEDGCDREHKDTNDDGKCDEGGEAFEDGCDNHSDGDDRDFICDTEGCEAFVEPEVAPTLIFDKNNSPTIVSKKGEVSYVFDEVRTVHAHLESVIGKRPSIASDTSTKAAHEIVIGDTSREITATAKAALAKKLAAKKPDLLERGLEENDIAGFLIYSDGSSVAIVWTHFQIAPKAIEYFSEVYADGPELKLSAGYEKSEFISLDGYLEEREDKILDAAWAEFEAAIPEEYREGIVREFKRLHSIYDFDAAAEWIASLYDPEIGGFYGVPSGRNAIGILPDIESTYYAFTLVGYMGMAELYGGNWWQAIPKDILDKAADWIYEMQDPDGYYYLPQWPKEMIEANNNVLRITRDKGSANTILSKAGRTPKYSSGTASGNALLGALGQSTVVAVSKVAMTSELLTEYESVENFRAYLDGFEAELKNTTDSNRSWLFYLWGSYFQPNTSILNKNPQMKAMVVEFFDKHQNPENGVWSENLDYNSTNAIHKIVSVYNALGVEVKYADKMIESTLTILKGMSKNPPTNTCNIYNIWSDFSYIYKNVRSFSSGTTAQREARCEAMKKLVYKGAADAIAASADEVEQYAKGNGAFSTNKAYSAVGTAPFMMGVTGTVEGDLAGFLFATYDISHQILTALELTDYEIPYFTEQDRLTYVNTLLSIEPPKKGSVDVSEVAVFDFEGLGADELPEGVKVSLDANRVPNPNSYVKVADDGTGNMALEFNATSRKVDNGRNYGATFNASHTVPYPTVARLEFSFKINKGTAANSGVFDLILRVNGSSSAIMQVHVGLDAQGNVYFTENSGAKVGNIGKVGEYIDFALEYEWGLGEYRIYSGGKYIGKGTSTYNGASHTATGSVYFGSNSSTTAKYYIDNLKFVTYIPEEK